MLAFGLPRSETTPWMTTVNIKQIQTKHGRVWLFVWDITGSVSWDRIPCVPDLKNYRGCFRSFYFFNITYTYFWIVPILFYKLRLRHISTTSTTLSYKLASHFILKYKNASCNMLFGHAFIYINITSFLKKCNLKYILLLAEWVTWSCIVISKSQFLQSTTTWKKHFQFYFRSQKNAVLVWTKTERRVFKLKHVSEEKASVLNFTHQHQTISKTIQDLDITCLF